MSNNKIKRNFLDIIIIIIIFFFYNIFLKLILLSLFWFLDIILAPPEKNLSKETEETGISRYLFLLK
jgi:hypothetical protein